MKTKEMMPCVSPLCAGLEEEAEAVQVHPAPPRFTGLSHICVLVEHIRTAVAYYWQLLGAEPDYCLPYWQNEGYFQASGFLEDPEHGEVSIAYLQVPGTTLTLELVQYHYPIGRKTPLFFQANDVSGVRHVTLQVENIDEAFAYIKTVPDTRLINETEAYRVFRHSPTTPEQVCYFDQDLCKADARNDETARRLSQIRSFSFLDKYGLQWEFEQSDPDQGV